MGVVPLHVIPLGVDHRDRILGVGHNLPVKRQPAFRLLPVSDVLFEEAHFPDPVLIVF
jgi:hypothetical protein